MSVERLRRRKDIQQLFLNGSVVSSKVALIRYAFTDLPVARAAIAPGKRLDKRAVVRNRIRRRIREALRTLPIMKKLDFVIVPRQHAINLGPIKIAQLLRQMFEEAGLLEKEDIHD